MPPRVAILPPVPVPYREPLFRSLAERGRVDPHVIYLVREPARLGPAVELVPRLTRVLEPGAAGVAAPARGANPGDARAGDRWRAHQRAPRLRRELGVRPGHDAGPGLDAPAARAAARLQRAHAMERLRTVAASAPRAPNAGAARGRVHRGGVAGSGAPAGARDLAVARGGGAPERGPGRSRRSGGCPARTRARRARAGPGRRPACGGQEPRRPDRRVRGGRLRRGGGRARDPRNRAARGGAARGRVAARGAGGAPGPRGAGPARRGVCECRRAGAREQLRAVRRDPARGRGCRPAADRLAARWRGGRRRGGRRERDRRRPGQPLPDSRRSSPPGARARATRAPGGRKPSGHGPPPARGRRGGVGASHPASGRAASRAGRAAARGSPSPAPPPSGMRRSSSAALSR